MINLHQPLYRVSRSISQHFASNIEVPIVMEDIGPGKLQPCEEDCLHFITPLVMGNRQTGLEVISLHMSGDDDECAIQIERFNNYGHPLTRLRFCKAASHYQRFGGRKQDSYVQVEYRTGQLTFDVMDNSVYASADYETTVPVYNKETGESAYETFGFGTYEFFAEEMVN